jgi:hypothetical protein
LSPSLSWIEPEALAAALVRAGARRAPRDLPRRQNLGLWRLTAEPLVAEPRPESGVGSRGRPQTATAPPFVPTGALLQDNLDAYVDWVAGETGSGQTFVADAEALVLTGRNADDELIAVSSSVMGLLERIRSCLGTETRGVLTLDLDGEKILHVIEVLTGLGRFTLGFVALAPVGRERIERLRAGLEGLLAAEESE